MPPSTPGGSVSAGRSGTGDEATQKKLLAFWSDYGRAYRREQIERFRTGMKWATVVELHNTTHAGFVFDEKQQAMLIRKMRKFLISPKKSSAM
jgi:hypothetical protein